MTRSETTNTFLEGLVMDLNPLTTPNTVLTSALNATLVTFNGNEYVLLNDMGNGRVETAYLPEGYIPMGTAELGGIIYVVSYNPLINKCLIGSFPSPERNITSDELANLPDVVVTNDDFQKYTDGKYNGELKTFLLKVSLLDSDAVSNITLLNPGDKYAIYCIKGGISGNKDYISDVGNEKTLLEVDSVPRTVTIHVVSIGDDGKITYLDDSLKWTLLGEDGYYYIKETESANGIQQDDVDNYRTLVNTAYNTFTSKVSGLLALLFELKVIDSFSLTWDADVSDASVSNTDESDTSESDTGESDAEGLQSYDKKATIKFEMNWSSSDSVINPKYAILELSVYSESLKAINNSDDDIVKEGSYCTFDDYADGKRNNDGSDENVIKTVGAFKYNSSKTLQDYIWSYKVTPAMKFGKLPYLAKEGSINFLDIGSGKIEITEWRYFILNTNFYMNCGFDIYPEKNKRIENITFYFIPFYKLESFRGLFAQSSYVNIYERFNDIPRYVITDRTSYAGNYQELINFGEFSRILNGTIEKDLLYLVNIVFKYGLDNFWEYRNHYRWLYTTGQWNEIYTLGEVLDFNTLSLDDVLSYDLEWEVVDNIGRQTSTRNSGVTKPNEISADPTYDMFGSMITTVNYDLSKESFDSSQLSYHVDTTTTITSYPNLFKFTQLEDDTYKFEIKLTSLQIDGDPVSYDMPSYLLDLITPKIKELNENDLIVLDEDLPSTIEGVALDGINSEDEDNKAIDLLEATLINHNNTSFDVNVKGALFSKIAATLIASNVIVKLTLKPFVFELTDLNKLGFSVNKNPEGISIVDTVEYFIEKHQDINGPGGFTFFFTSNINGTDRTTTSLDDFGSETDNHLDYWWSGNRSFYTQLVNLMNRLKSCFKIVYTFGDGDNRTMFTNWFNEGETSNNLHDYYYVWIKTENGNYLPINCFRKGELGRKELAKFLLVFYSQLYYVDTELMETTLPVVSNIVYATNYREIYDILISSSISIAEDSSLDAHVSLYSDNELSTLKDILDFLANEGGFISTNNISTSKEIKYKDKTLSHTFSLINENLYNTFLRGKETTIGGFAYLSSSSNVSLYNIAKDSRYIYVYNPEIQDFLKISSNSGKNIYYLSTDISILDDGRVIFSYSTNPKLTIGNLEILDYIQAKDGELVFSESSVLIDTYDLYFHTSAKGGGLAGLMAHGNSNLLINPNFKCPYNQ